jgi:hypothetical protein
MLALSQLRSEFKKDIKERLKHGVLALIQDDRKESNQALRELNSKCIHVMLALNFYRGDFEDSFLLNTEQYYRQDSLAKVQTMSVGEYIDYVNEVIKNERERV